MGTSVWGQELSAVSTATVWDFASLSFSQSTTEGQFLQDNTIYVGANVDRDGTNGRARFTGGYSSMVTELGNNIIAIKTGAAGQLIMRISSYYGSIIVSDGTNTKTFASGSGYHGGSLAYLRAALDVEADKTYYIYTSNTEVKNTDNVGVFKLMYFPLENTTVAFSSTEEVTKTFTDYPRLNNGAENITYKGITYDNVYMGNGVKYNTVSGKERMLLGAATEGPLPTQNYMSFKLPKGKGTLTIKASSYNATVKMSNGTKVLVESFTHGDPAYVYNYESETETTLYYYATSYNANQYTGIFYLTWTPTTHTYTINAVDGNGTTLTELASAKCMEGDNYSLSGLPKVIEKDGKYYVLNDGTVTKYATQNYTMGTSDETTEITYIEDASIVYYADVENLSNSGVEQTGAYSNGKVAHINSSKAASLTTLPAGCYTVTGCWYNNGNGNRGLYLRSSSANTSENVNVGIGEKTWSGEHSKEFTLKASTSLYLTGYTGTAGNNPSLNQSAALDYIIIRSVNNVSATIGSTGWTTFSSAYPLDLSNMTSSSGTVTAYYASVVGANSVTLTSTNKSNLAAGQGIMLKGTAGATITIPVVASGEAISGNKLVGCPNETKLGTNENYYVLVKKDESTPEFQSLRSNGATIPAGKAYLNAGAAARSLQIVFDETTGVEAMHNAQCTMHNEMYDLQGRRVAQPKKGLYIKDGQKVYIK